MQIRIVGLPGNTEALGAAITIETLEGNKQYRQVRLENNFVSRNPSIQHFGLGTTKGIKRVTIDHPMLKREINMDSPDMNTIHTVDFNHF